MFNLRLVMFEGDVGALSLHRACCPLEASCASGIAKPNTVDVGGWETGPAGPMLRKRSEELWNTDVSLVEHGE